jgi:hypothetical protein
MRYRTPGPRGAALAALVLLASCPACGPRPPTGKFTVYPVEGSVLFEGKPLAGAGVSFHPVDESRFGDAVPRPTGQTDREGRFRLMTYAEGDGAPAGSYLVSVAGVSRPLNEPGNLLDPSRTVTKTDVLRGRFLDPKTSGLKAEVKEGKNVIPAFELE